MNYIRNFKIAMLLAALSACSSQSTQPIQDTSSTSPVDSEITVEPISKNNSLSAPDLTKSKVGKTLKLSRIMEGGACKNNRQGAVGMFQLYANPDDIKRIQQNQGAEVFADFELRISNFSEQTLQQAVNSLDFQGDTSALNKKKIQQQLIEELTNLFNELITDDIAEFEAETTLTIDVAPLPDSLNIYLDGCEIPHGH